MARKRAGVRQQIGGVRQQGFDQAAEPKPEILRVEPEARRGPFPEGSDLLSAEAELAGRGAGVEAAVFEPLGALDDLLGEGAFVDWQQIDLEFEPGTPRIDEVVEREVRVGPAAVAQPQAIVPLLKEAKPATVPFIHRQRSNLVVMLEAIQRQLLPEVVEHVAVLVRTQSVPKPEAAEQRG